MRTEITFTPSQFLKKRIDYITDADGAHKIAGLEVKTLCVGVGSPDELRGQVRRLLSGSVGLRGAKRKHVAWELTIHPTDADGAKSPFRNTDEMERVARDVLGEFGAKYALVGFHGLQDIHILILNWGVTGVALKSHLPNRSNPRRVLVAVADRIEAELNVERAKEGVALLIPMKDVREIKRKGRGRLSLHEEIAGHLAVDKVPSLVDILDAIAACGWTGVANKKKVSVSFSPERSPKQFELDFFLNGVMRAWKKKIRDKEKAVAKPVVPEKPLYETLVAAVNRFMQTGKYDSAAGEWLDFTDGDSAMARSVTARKALGDLLAGDKSAGAIELREVIDLAGVVRDQRIRDKKDETQKGLPLDP